MKNSISTIFKITWDDCREKVLRVSPVLAKIIDRLSPDKDMPFWVAKYPYGVMIGDSQFYYPTTEGKLVPLSQHSKALQDDFAYAGIDMPAGVVLEKTIELFIESENRILPQVLYMPGDIFALWGRLDPNPAFHPTPLMYGTAGARSIFMIPNISDQTSHKRLKKEFNVKQSPPKNLSDQWEIFTSISNNSQIDPMWHTEILLFTGKWFEKIKNDSAFHALYIHFLEYVWQSSAYWRNKAYYDYIFSCVQKNRNLKPSPYIVDTAKHLITIATSSVPGFGAACNDLTAPIDLIQKAYVESYGLKKYAPTIFHPVYFSLNAHAQSTYYSLQYPTTLEFSPRSRQSANTLSDLSELKHILSVLLNEISRKKLDIEHGVMGKIAEEVGFSFFHCKPDHYGEISSTNEIINNDHSLIDSSDLQSSRVFCESGAFVRGCVRMQKNE